jgi:adenine deaminase
MKQLTARVADVVAGTVRAATVTIEDGRIAAIHPAPDTPGLRTLVPGLVDAHVHIESSMLPPSEFARIATVHGTVAAVCDPHEIANVMGVDGVRFMLEDAAHSPMKLHFGAPSSVPASPHETSGAHFDAETIGGLLDRPDVHFLGEVMNVPGVLDGDPALLAVLEAARARGARIDGHAPTLIGEDLARYAAAGIETDHECRTLEEAEARLAVGMKVSIRDGSAARDLASLLPLLERHPGAVMLCSDDRHPDDLLRGHIDAMLRQAMAAGVDPMAALRAATLAPVRHYGLDVGLLQVGDPADFLEIDALSSFRVLRTVIDGVEVASGGRSLLPRRSVDGPNTFACSPKSAAEFRLPMQDGLLRVILALDGRITTHQALQPATERDGLAVPDPERDLLMIAVVNRYRDAPPAVGFVRGFGLSRGAIASSVAHDAHNVVAVGTSAEMIARAVNLVIARGGGIAAVDDYGVDVLPLPIAGLMSDDDHREVGRAYQRLTRRARELGSRQTAPFMTLSFMALLVVPELKISDRGLFLDGVAVEPFAPAPPARHKSWAGPQRRTSSVPPPARPSSRPPGFY